jgi:hypothetical protein
MKVLFCPMLPNNRKNDASFVGSQALPPCPSGTKCIKMKASMEQWWNNTDRGK